MLELQGWNLSEKEAIEILSYFQNISEKEKDDHRNLPFELFAQIQKQHTRVGWISMDHSSDYVELYLNTKLKSDSPYIRNTDLHKIVLDHVI